jgi:hypothetical protein
MYMACLWIGNEFIGRVSEIGVDLDIVGNLWNVVEKIESDQNHSYKRVGLQIGMVAKPSLTEHLFENGYLTMSTKVRRR